MDDKIQVRSADRLTDLLANGADDDVREYLNRLELADPEIRKDALQALRCLSAERPRLLDPVLDGLIPFLTDEERSIRLTTVKAFVDVAEASPEVAVSAVDPLANRLADEDEFYYVRARSAEALGYVALKHPGTVASPELLADLRLGLSFDEPEVKVKLAKALEYVALGEPGRLRHQLPSLAEHLDDENEFVRYHLATAIVVVGCAYPVRLTDVTDALATRLSDENETPYVRGRAAEALGLLARANLDEVSVPEALLSRIEADEAFLTERIRYARTGLTDGKPDEIGRERIGSVEAIRGTTEAVVEELASSDGDSECPHCGLMVPETSPPMCPRCGAPD